jgi:hypothetical protein
VLNALVFGILHVTILVIVSVVLWRIFLALYRKYAIGRHIGIAIIVLGSLLLSALVLRTMVQYTVLAVEAAARPTRHQLRSKRPIMGRDLPEARSWGRRLRLQVGP